MTLFGVYLAKVDDFNNLAPISIKKLKKNKTSIFHKLFKWLVKTVKAEQMSK